MEGTILNKPKQHRKGIVIERSGRITLRSRPCRLLSLTVGCYVSFALAAGQMYLLREPQRPVNEGALRLCGRPSQMHCCSVATAQELFRQTTGADDRQKIELNVSPEKSSVVVDGVEFEALAIINIVDNL